MLYSDYPPTKHSMQRNPIQSKKRNLYISYIKGWAILCVMLIHLIDWSNIELLEIQKLFKEILYPSVLLFIAMVGSVVYIAYHHYANLRKPTIRLITRGLQLIGIYYLYNIVKLFLFDFSKEPFYRQFTERSSFSLYHILSLQSFSVPITIIFTIGIFLLISPLFLYIVKEMRYKKTILMLILMITFTINYLVVLPENVITDFLYSRGYVMFPPILWLVPYLIGFYIALIGFEKHAGKMFIIFLCLTGISLFIALNQHQTWFVSSYMYPLQLYYITASFLFMSALLYLFRFLEKRKSQLIHYLLGCIRLLGDFTLSIYIYHWIVIDLTIWLLFPSFKLIWITVTVFLAVFIFVKRKVLKEYVEHQKQVSVQELKMDLE